MTVTGTIDTSAAIDPGYPNFDYGEPVLFGDYVAWRVLWDDYDNYDFKPSVDVILASVTSDDPAFTVSDRRCGGGWSVFTDDEGDDCLLRMPLGGTEFDPDFYVDLNAVANTPAVYHTWRSTGRNVVAAVWDPANDPSTLASEDDYWTTPLKRKLVRIDESSSKPLEGIPDSSVYSTTNDRLDDELYMLMSEGADEDISSQLYRVTDTRAVLSLSTVGDLWSIGRIR